MRQLRSSRRALAHARFVLCLVLSLVSGAVAASGQALAIGPYHLQGSTRVSTTQYDYTYTADLTNSGAALQGIVGTVSSSSANTLVTKGSVNFGPVGANSTVTSTDTFTIRQDRRYAFDPANLSWVFSQGGSKPTANAGTGQTLAVGQTVTLNGTGSTDPNGHGLTYVWSFVSVPSGSTASLVNPTSAMPTFTVDKFGDYVIQLVVNNGTQSSDPATVNISTLRTAPTANAGPNQSAPEGTLVQLDGSASTDPDGNALTYAWSVVSVPAGSTAVLSSTTAVKPTFTLDKFGSYVLQLVVSDTYLSSAPSQVIIGTTHTPPVADAGPAQSVTVGKTVTLDGSLSSDADGFPLTYSWSLLSVPAGSTATLNGATTVHPSFGVDVAGSYVAQLIVNDGFNNSTPKTVTISTQMLAPTAYAGPAQTVAFNATVQLDGTGSADPNGLPLTYAWTFLSRPAGSAAALSSATAAKATFVADKQGTYVMQLTVNDGSFSSTPATVTITVSAPQPVANAGTNQTVAVGDLVGLNGLESTDPAGNALTYSWSFVTTPGAAPSLNGASTATPSFLASAAGTYTLQLVVNNGSRDSAAATVQIVAIVPTLTLSPPSLSFADQAIGTSSSAKAITATNSTSAPITFGSIGATGDFNSGLVSTCGATLLPGSSCTVSVIFSPSTTGSRSGTLAFNDNAASTPQSVSLSGTGIPGTATKLVIGTQPTNTTAGANSSPAITVLIEDGSGNTVTSANGAVTLALANNPTGATLSGTLTTTAVNGVASFSGLSVNKIGTGYTLAATASGLASATTAAFNITPGSASKLAFAVQPSNTAAGDSITPAVTVTVQDAGGNTVTTATNSVTLALGANPGSGTLSGTVTVAAVNGVATFANLNIGSGGVGYTLVASSTGLTSATSNAFTISAGTPTQLVFTVQPSTTVVSSFITPAVQVSLEDAQGNVVTTATNFINLSFGNNPGGGSLGGTVSRAAVNGVATFSNLSVGKIGTGYTLQASATNLTAVQSTAFDVTPGPAAKLAFVSEPSNTTAGATITPAVTVAIEDAAGNTVTTATSAVTLAFINNASAGTLGGTLTVNAVNGIATFPNLSINNAGLNYSLGAASTGLSSTTSSAFNITPGNATKLVFTAQPSNAGSGATITPAITVSVEDAGGGVVTSSTVPVTLAFSSNPGFGTLSGTITVNAVNGVATFPNISIDKAATGYVLRATSAGLTTALSSAFTIAPGAASKLIFSTDFPPNAAAGATITPAIQVQIKDAAGNVVTSATNTVSIAIGTNPVGGTLSGTLTADAVAGVATFSNLSINKAGGSYTFNATSAGLVSGSSGNFTITAGPIVKLGFVTQPANTAAGATLSSVQVAIQDATGTTNTAATNAVTLAIGTNPASGTLAGTLTANAVNGVATFTGLSINNPGTGYTLAASSTGLTAAASSPFNITGVDLTINPQSPLVGVGTSLAGTITLGQAAPAGGVVVMLSSSNPANVTISPASLTIAQGQTTGSFSYSGVQAGPSTLSASATGYNTSTANVTATASLISLGAVGNVTAGQTVSLPLSLGTPAPTGGLTVNLISSNPAIATITSSVFIPAGSTIPSANPQITALAIGAVQITASASNFAPNGESVNIIAPIATLSPNPYAAHVTLTSTLTLNLSVAAPAGGTIFTLTTDNASIATVASPVTVAAGSTTAVVSVTGVALGSTTLRANSPGVTEATATINVTAAPTITISAGVVGNNLIQALGLSLSVAPPSNQTLTLTSSDPAHFLLSTTATAAGSTSVTVNINSGSTSVPTIYVQGQNFSGTAAINSTLTASSSGYVNGSGAVSLYPTGFGFSNSPITTTSFSANTTLTAYLVVLNPGTLTYYTYGSNLGPQAPAVSLAIASSDTTAGTILGSPVSFAAGTYYNQAASFHPVGAGTTNLSITEPAGFYTPATGFPAQITATVTASAITVNGGVVGNNLVQGISLSLAAPSPAAQTLTVTSSDPTHFLLSASPTAVGSSSVTVNLTANSTSVPAIYVEGQNYSGTTAITATLTASSSGFTTGTGSVSLYPTGFGFSNSPITTTSFSSNTTLTAYLVVLNPGTLTYYTYGNNLGPQASAVSLAIASSATTAGTITGSPATFSPGNYYNQAISFHPVGSGTTNLTLTEPAGYSTPANGFPAQITATVTAPAITVTSGVVGNNLIQGVSLSLAAAPPSNQTLTLTSSDPTHFLLSTSPTAVGGSSVTVNLTANSPTVPTIYIEGQNFSGTATINATLTASSAGFMTGTGTVSLYPTGFGFNGGTLSTTTFSSNSTLTAYLVVLNPGTLTYYTYGNGLGPQAPGVSLAVSSSSTTVGTVIGSPATFAGYFNQAISFHPVSAGTTNLTLAQPAGYYTPASSFFSQITATVTAPAITVNNAIIGNNTVTGLSIGLGAPPPSNETLTITSADPTHFLLSITQNGAGSASVTVQLTGGSAGIPSVYVQGRNFSGSTAITGAIMASAAGYSDGSGVLSLYPTGIGFLNATYNTTATATAFSPTVYLLLLNPGTLTYYTYGYALGPQASVIPVAISNSNASAGTISGSPTTIGGGAYFSNTITYKPAAAGTSVLTLTEPPGYFTPTNQPLQTTVTVSP